jgi:hypothetical protein
MSDELFAELAELPALDIHELGAARVRKRSHQVLERKRNGRPAQSRTRRALLIVQSTVIGAVATGYLFWVVESVLTPYR